MQASLVLLLERIFEPGTGLKATRRANASRCDGGQVSLVQVARRGCVHVMRTLGGVLLAAGIVLVTMTGATSPGAGDDRSRQPDFDLQAHRGGIGLRPESSPAAFENALELGVTTLGRSWHGSWNERQDMRGRRRRRRTCKGAGRTPRGTRGRDGSRPPEAGAQVERTGG